MTTMPELTVVIPTYKRHEALRRTLAALERQTVSADRFEVVVVDDPEEDDPSAVSAVLAASQGSVDLRHLHRGSTGVSAARNAGWMDARGSLVLFIGDDILAAPDLLAQHLAWHESHPDVHMGMLGHVRWADELGLTPFMVWLDHGIQFDYGRLESAEAGWGMFYTSNVSLKKVMLERVGGFDEERFPFLYEDTDLGFRLNEIGFQLLYNARASAEHLHQPRLEDWKSRMREVARAEHRWVSMHPEMEPYFERLFRDAAAQPPIQARLARALVTRLPRSAPVVGKRIWWRADLHYRQQLAPAFLSAWGEETGDPGADAAKMS